MKLSPKLFISYMVVVAIALLVLVMATAFVAPENFSQRMQMHGAPQNQNRGAMQGHMAVLDSQLEGDFRDAVNSALFLAGGAAVLAALVVSWYVSRRIVTPIQALARLSQRIASGHYEERLAIHTTDELAELGHSFNRMAAALAESEAIRQQLLADVTHELKTPLASIKGYMEGLQDGVVPATPETFGLVHREADRLQRLVQDLQELSSAQAGQTPVTVQRCQAVEIVMPVIERMRPQFLEKDVVLDTNIAENLPAVCADPDRLAQVLTNLIGNALQYTPVDGSVTISVRRETSMLRFVVADTGIGLAPENLERIFERFYRVDKSRSRASGGSGIGLTITRYLVEAQGGRIHAESAGPGQGSAFSFTLPLA